MANLDKIDFSELSDKDGEVAEQLKKHINQRAGYFRMEVAQFNLVLKGLK